MKPAGRYLFPVDFMKRSVRNRNLARPMVFGAEHYTGREAPIGPLLLRNEESPGFFAFASLTANWERMTINYIRNVTKSVRRATQMGCKSGRLKELKRLARASQGCQSPRAFSMETSKCYWRLSALPKMDPPTGRAENRSALQKVLASFGSPGNTPKLPVDQVPPPNPKGWGVQTKA